MMKALIGREKLEQQIREEMKRLENRVANALPPGSVGADGIAQTALNGDTEPLLLEAPQSHEMRLEFAQNMVDQDPKRVAQVIKNWVQESD